MWMGQSGELRAVNGKKKGNRKQAAAAIKFPCRGHNSTNQGRKGRRCIGGFSFRIRAACESRSTGLQTHLFCAHSTASQLYIVFLVNRLSCFETGRGHINCFPFLSSPRLVASSTHSMIYRWKRRRPLEENLPQNSEVFLCPSFLRLPTVVGEGVSPPTGGHSLHVGSPSCPLLPPQGSFLEVLVRSALYPLILTMVLHNSDQGMIPIV